MSSQQQQQHHSRTTAGQSGTERPLQPIHSQRPARQPLGIKNSMSTATLKSINSKTEANTSGGDEAHPIKPLPNSHFAPPSRLRRPAAVPHPSPISTASAISTTTPTSHSRIYTSHHPSPLGLKAGELPGSDDNTSGSSQVATAPLSPSIVKTPKKRAIPLEDVHARNTVPGHQVDPQSPNPNKRSRSSKNGSNSTDPSTSTSQSIATGLGDVNLQSQGAAAHGPTARHQSPPPVPTHHIVQPTSHTSRAAVQPSHSRQTTTRIDKHSRMTENDRQIRERQKMETQKEWRKKFLKAFPSFHFHLDGFDEATRKEATAVIEQLGGSIEPFFSNTVSHLVTTRKVPLGGIPETQTGPLALVLPLPSSRLQPTASATASRFSRLPALRKKNTNIPLHSDRNPFEESGPPLPANDILVKAKNAGMKVWTLDKFRTVMASLLGEDDPKKQHSLTQLLEKVPSIIDRDPLASRENFHYFSKNTAYILIEDATGEHRPIMYQEWKKPAENELAPWPVLYGQLEGRCPFTKFDYDGDLRKRMKPNRHETLKRSVSLNHLHRGLGLSPAPSGDSRGGYGINRGASPYPLASGNSVSNIASTTSTAMTGPSGLGLIPPYGAGALGRKVNQASAIGLGRPSSVPSNARSSHSHSSTAAGGAVAMNEQARGSLVRRMLGITEQNRNSALSMVRRSVSTASAGHQLRREKKPGYCENCRAKYDDFDEHIAGRKHRKFAEDDSHFAEIDTLLHRIGRPIAPWAMTSGSTHGSVADVDASSHSSLLAAGGSLLEVEGVAEAEEDADDRAPHLHSPRGFMDTMHQWQQATQMTDQKEVIYAPPISSPYARRSPSVPIDLGEAGKGDVGDLCEQESNSSHGGHTNAGDTTATTMDHQNEEEMITLSPDTSPQIHHQYHHHEKQEQDGSYTASFYGTAM